MTLIRGICFNPFIKRIKNESCTLLPCQHQRTDHRKSKARTKTILPAAGLGDSQGFRRCRHLRCKGQPSSLRRSDAPSPTRKVQSSLGFLFIHIQYGVTQCIGIRPVSCARIAFTVTGGIRAVHIPLRYIQAFGCKEHPIFY